MGRVAMFLDAWRMKVHEHTIWGKAHFCRYQERASRASTTTRDKATAVEQIHVLLWNNSVKREVFIKAECMYTNPSK